MGLADGGLAPRRALLTYANIAVFHPGLFATSARHELPAFSLGVPVRRRGARDGRAIRGSVGKLRDAGQLAALDRRLSAMTFYIPATSASTTGGARALRRGQTPSARFVSAGAGGPSVSHIPFLPERGADGRLRLLGAPSRAANAHGRRSSRRARCSQSSGGRTRTSRPAGTRATPRADVEHGGGACARAGPAAAARGPAGTARTG